MAALVAVNAQAVKLDERREIVKIIPDALDNKINPLDPFLAYQTSLMNQLAGQGSEQQETDLVDVAMPLIEHVL